MLQQAPTHLDAGNGFAVSSRDLTMTREGVEEDDEEKENEEEEEEEEMQEQDRQLREQQRLSVGLAALAHPLSFSVLGVRGLTRNGLRLQLAGLVFTGLVSVLRSISVQQQQQQQQQQLQR